MTKAYEVVLYHDSETDAAEDSTRAAVCKTQALAVKTARRRLDGHWQSAAIYAGHIERDEYTGLLEFVDDERERWYVGPDYVDHEATAA